MRLLKILWWGKEKIGILIRGIPASLETHSFGSRQFLNWIWNHSKSEFLWMCLAMVSAAGVSSLSSISLVYARNFIDAVGKGDDTQKLLKLVGLIVLIFLGGSVLKLMTTTLGALAATNIRRNLEVACFQHLSRLPYEYLEGKSSGRFTGALMSEVPMVSYVIEIVLRSFIRAPFTILMAAAVLWYNSSLAAMVALVSLPFLFVGIRFFSRVVKQSSAHAYEGISAMHTKMSEHLSGIRVVRCMGLIDWYANRMGDLSKDIALKSRRAEVFCALQQTAQELVSLGVLMGFLFWLSWKVIEGTMQIGQALLVPMSILLIRNESLKISAGIVAFRKTEGAATRLRELLLVQRKLTGSQRLAEPLNSVGLADVCFQYPDGLKVFEGVNLDLHPGGLTVIIGESGAGKSTICDLCLRLRLPTDGKIIFNDVMYERLDEEFMRNCTALVEQEPHLFEGTIRQNLLLAGNSVTDGDLWKALALANAGDFIKAMPNGLGSEVGEKGRRLSVGQRQRIALARALLRKPQFLVLDEFTSSLDLESEFEILQTIKELSRQIIILCTTHRTSVLRIARDVYKITDKRLQKINV